MSLLTKITSLFSNKPTKNLVGISLRNQAITLCSIPAKKTIEGGKDESIFQEQSSSSSNISKALAQFQEESKIEGQCHIVLSANHSQIIQVDKPNVPDAEIAGALKWQIKELVSIPPDDMVLDYFDNPIIAGGKKKINVVCAPLTELKEVVSAVNQSGSEVKSITIQEFAFANLLPTQDDATLILCQQPGEDVTILIVKQAQLYFHRRLRGFSQISTKSESELATITIDSLNLEIQRSTDYFERQLKQAAVKEIKVIIPIEHEAFLARKLAENTVLPVSLLSIPEPYQQHRSYAAVIGAIMSADNSPLNVKSDFIDTESSANEGEG